MRGALFGKNWKFFSENVSGISGLLTFLLFFTLSIPLQAAVDPADRAFLQQIEKDTVQYFIHMSDKLTGLTRDSSRPGSPASVAATGFALAAVAIGQSHGWVDSQYAYRQIDKTLRTLLDRAEHKNGFFYHFLDMRTAKRVWASEASSIDTAILLAGALLAAQYFPDSEVEKMARALYERVDWKWMMNGSDFLCMGWKPGTGFLPYYWDRYSEHLVLQALALGSPTHPTGTESWHAWRRESGIYNGKTIVHASSGSLFTYQYSHAFIDFRKLDDGGINYFENSRLATLANWEYSLSFQDRYRTYGPSSWGLSASLGPGGYKSYGAKPGEGLHDGTIAPHGALGSIIFTPELSTEAAKFFHSSHGSKVYGKFGFVGGFNADRNWWADEYLGIDEGIIVLMLENFLHEGAVWQKFMRLEPVERWLGKARLRTRSPKGGEVISIPAS